MKMMMMSLLYTTLTNETIYVSLVQESVSHRIDCIQSLDNAALPLPTPPWQ
jgi:hypothetical protein